jgi:hypothetical protein
VAVFDGNPVKNNVAIATATSPFELLCMTTPRKAAHSLKRGRSTPAGAHCGLPKGRSQPFHYKGLSGTGGA